jgi:1-acyl-sn-glycerol-3-phosphate acyltransferase
LRTVTDRNVAVDRERFTRTVIELLGTHGEDVVGRLRSGLSEVVAAARDDEILRLIERMRETGGEWGYHPHDPLARRLARPILRALLEPGSTLHDPHHLEICRSEAVVFLGNHLSLVDANVFEHLASEAGFPEVSERMTVLVGPKVYAMPLRRLASLCFGAVKLPQSPSRASGEAVMPQREVVRLASEAIRTAGARQAEGEHLLIFVEGTRSRSLAMHRGLAAVSRYLEGPTRWIVPFGLWGSEALLRLDEEQIHPARVEARVGKPIRPEDLFERCTGKRPLAIDTVGLLIADLLPDRYRGFYSGEDAGLAAAREIAGSLA